MTERQLIEKDNSKSKSDWQHRHFVLYLVSTAVSSQNIGRPRNPWPTAVCCSSVAAAADDTTGTGLNCSVSSGSSPTGAPFPFRRRTGAHARRGLLPHFTWRTLYSSSQQGAQGRTTSHPDVTANTVVSLGHDHPQCLQHEAPWREGMFDQILKLEFSIKKIYMMFLQVESSIILRCLDRILGFWVFFNPNS